PLDDSPGRPPGRTVGAVSPLNGIEVPSPAVKVLIVSFYFPPAGGGGVQRPLKLAQDLPAMGVETHVLAPDDPRWMHRDEGLRMPTQAWVHRARYVGVSGGKPSEVLAGTDAIACVSEAISEETRALGPRGPVVTIPNGCDFDDVVGLERSPSDRFRLTH